jgi:hypothetical protein
MVVMTLSALLEKSMKFSLTLLLLVVGISPIAVEASSDLRCKLKPTEDGWSGPCGKLNKNRLSLNIRETESIDSGIWRSEMKPSDIWTGAMKIGDRAQRLVEIERYEAGPEFARTAFGWFQITDWTHSENAIMFVMHTDKKVNPSDLDVLIIQRAKKLLASAENWNRQDNRKCISESDAWSIYCALIQASIDTTGGSHHRRPALQVVREIVHERSKGRSYQHRLMDYNNDQSTQIEDVHSLFEEALEKISLIE